MGSTSPPRDGCVLFALRLGTVGAEGDEEAGPSLFDEEKHIPGWKQIYLGVETMSEDLEKALRRGNQMGLNPLRASFQAISMLLPVQGL